MTEARRPFHLGVFLGLSAGAYAISLAAVTAFQAQSELVVAADRAPAARAIAELAAGHDTLESRASIAGQAYGRASVAYDAVGRTLSDVEVRLSDLAGVVGEVDGAANALPDRVALPRINRAAATVSRPTVHATTAASGG